MTPEKEIQELLAVLDMTEDDQFDWLADRRLLQFKEYQSDREAALAALAFKMRDELVLHTPYSKRYSYNLAFNMVSFNMVYERAKENEEEGAQKAGWGLYWSQPIHWIIAALMAEILAKGK